MYIRSYDGQKHFGNKIQTIAFSSSDNIRGWSWDIKRKTVSYVAYDKRKRKSILYIRSFANGKLGKVTRTVTFTSTDNIRGWSWDMANYIATYVVYQNGKRVLYHRYFDGKNFGKYTTARLGTKDSIRGWSWDLKHKKCSFLFYAKKSVQNSRYHTYLNHRDFDGKW